MLCLKGIFLNDSNKNMSNMSAQDKADKFIIEEGYAANRGSSESYQMFSKYIFWIDGGAIALISAFYSSLNAASKKCQPVHKGSLSFGMGLIIISIILLLLSLIITGDGYSKRYLSNMNYVQNKEYENLEKSADRLARVASVLTWIIFGLSIVGLSLFSYFFVKNI